MIDVKTTDNKTKHSLLYCLANKDNFYSYKRKIHLLVMALQNTRKMDF